MIVSLQETKKKTQSHRGKGDVRMEAEVVRVVRPQTEAYEWPPEAGEAKE